MPPTPCVIGVGSPHGDDQIGWLIADAVQTRLAGVVVHKVTSPLEILDRIEGIEWLGICDACRGSGAEGSWRHWTWPDEQLVQSEFTGTHGIGLTATLELADRLGRLPATVLIWGVEVGACKPGDAISKSMDPIISQVAHAIVQELRLSC